MRVRLLASRLLISALAAVILVTLAVAWVFYIQRGAHLELKGAILKVRTLAMDENRSVALIDFRLANVADYPWMVRWVSVSLIGGQGGLVEGTTISDQDTTRLFEYFPLVGQKFNQSLVPRARIQPHQSLDRMIAAQFEIPEAELKSRRILRVRIEDVDGAVSEIAEDGRK